MTAIAIVGMDGRFPRAPDLDALWQLLLAGGDGIAEVPDDRWPVADFYDAAGGPGTSNTRNAGLLSDADAFDHEFFAIAPSEAAAMDPQQRLLLQTAWRALEDATIDPRSVAGSNTGVYVGLMASEWSSVHLIDFARITAQHGSGAGYFMNANRLSYHLDLKGPSVAVDTACSSSLVAVQQACTALRAGACDQALAGGVNLVLTPALNIFYTQAGLSAPDGRCKPFSAHADGIGRGEGVAVLVLRRLADAVDAGLPIYAVIEGGAVNSDGRSNGITAPNRWAQKQVLTSAYRDAGVAPEQIDFVEAHGTGTVLGDMIEAKALADVHGRGSGRAAPCAIGSIKGNLGHTEGAAGIAGLIKAALSLHHGILPPSRFADEPNPQLRLADNGLRLADEATALPGGVVRAGVSSFGIGGTNAHVVLASAPATRDAGDGAPSRAILTVSSAGRDGLRRAAAGLADDLGASPAGRFGQLAWSSNRVKASGRHRLAICAHDRDQAADALREAAADEARLSAVSGVARPISAGWLFTGQGSQYPGMSRALHDTCALYRDALAAVDDAMAPHLGRSIRELLFEADGDTIDRTEFAQPAIFALEYAVAAALATVGVLPAWMLGHSVGEFAAAVIAGVFDLADASALVVARGRLMQELPAGGGMLAVGTGEAEVADLIAGEPALGLAAVNGPREVVISGDASALERVRGELSERGVAHKRLAVSHAFHSPSMAPAAAAFGEVASRLAYGAPEIPIYSTVRGRLLAFDEPMDGAYWVEQITSPVRFADAAGEALQADPTHLLEIGPRQILAPIVARIAPGSDIPALLPCPGPAATGDELDEVVAALYRDGLDPAWDALSEPGQRVPRRLSGYAFSTDRRFWMQQTPPGQGGAAPAAPAASSPVTTSREDPTMDGLIALFREQNAVLAALANNGARPATSAAAGRPDRPAAPGAAGATQIAATVRAQAALVSGFPQDTLRDTHSLTGDLGFDSIMVTDLAGRITQALPGVTFDPGAFTWEATIGDLIAHLTGRAGGAAVPAAEAEAEAVPVASVDGTQPAAAVAEESRIEDFPEVREIADRLRGAAALGLENPYFLVNDGVTRDTSVIDGNETVNFSSYNYLGLSGHPVVTAAVQDAVARYGSSVSSSRLLSGEKPVHQELEAELAALLGSDDAIVLTAGHATNVSVIGHIVGPGDLLIHDALAHNSIMEGAKLSGATRRPFPHDDAAALDEILTAVRHGYRRVLIVVEGVYSQDGDIADLPALIDVKRRHRALLMIDEAHSLGVLGAAGGGVGEHFGVDRADVELWSGTLSKSLASCGGYVAGSRELIQYLKYTTPGFIFSAGMTPANAAAALAAVRQMRAEPEALAALQRNAELFLELARAAGVDTGDSAGTPIIPCIVGDSLKTLRLSTALLRRGINVNPILYPAVPEELARLRFFVTSCHSEEQIRHAVQALAEELALLREPVA
ncbi:MAG: aminotransferase class I/II-fold pyridoxal phosphate-dependent enzyme [Solirubrobacteraceae bacterium]|nr:aminotransferase class I/II-fold pyridoxal phosphate-dependent enzyme [Solirubrobacteraceae bacterium]